MEWMKEIKVIIFDLDGTLYQDHSFYRRYLSYLVEGIEVETQLDTLIDEVEQILSHQHSFKLGYLYDAHHDHALELEQGQIKTAYTWKGGEVETDEFHKLYGAKQISLQNHFYAGDAWSVIGIIAKRLNIQEQQIRQAFIRVRKDMISESFGILRDAHLIKAIEKLTAVKKKVLITNTHAESGIEFVHYLGINHLFDEITYDGNKPQGIEQRVQSLLEQDNLEPHQILSIGDNAWNELYPVKRIGGRTAWISPYSSSDQEPWDIRLHTLGDLSHFLSDLQLQLHTQNEVEIVK